MRFVHRAGIIAAAIGAVVMAVLPAAPATARAGSATAIMTNGKSAFAAWFNVYAVLPDWVIGGQQALKFSSDILAVPRAGGSPVKLGNDSSVFFSGAAGDTV